MDTFSLIIPFYNEGVRILNTLQQLEKAKHLFKEIICVDDGSNDKTSRLISVKYAWVKLIKIPVNLGKADAIKRGLSVAFSDNIVTLDADLNGVGKVNWKKVLNVFLNNKLDMLIVDCRKDRTLDRLILSGTRVIRRRDLIKVFKLLKPKRYNLELAVNQYSISNNKKIGVFKSILKNLPSFEKRGLLGGLIKEVFMYYQFLMFFGLGEYSRQLRYFAKYN